MNKIHDRKLIVNLKINRMSYGKCPKTLYIKVSDKMTYAKCGPRSEGAL